jgi:hypothetical protein
VTDRETTNDRDDHQRSAPENRPGQRDPHSPLNTPVSEIEAQDAVERLGRRDSVRDVTGMGRPQTSDTRGSEGDPVMRDDEDRETHNPAQTTPRGVLDAEQEAMLRAEQRTGVPLTDEDGQPG